MSTFIERHFQSFSDLDVAFVAPGLELQSYYKMIRISINNVLHPKLFNILVELDPEEGHVLLSLKIVYYTSNHDNDLEASVMCFGC